ncbi:hypothetical protein HKL94_00725 [Candidatus Parcubacteria bacterium]|nr:hypothetical protein [Candidatus Parcubacteria bacterium]
MKNKIGYYLVSGSVLLGSILVAGTAFAAGPGPGFGAHGMRPAIVGIVSTAPDGSGTFMITAKPWRRNTTPPPPTSVVYTVTTTGTTVVTRSGAASTVSAIAVGDMVVVQGTVSGTTVTATIINDRVKGHPWIFAGKRFWGDASSTHAVAKTQFPVGNGQPVVGGTVTAVNGDSLTITNNGSTTYTVDVASTTVAKIGVTGATISNIAVGDSVIVQGTINGSSVIASSVIDKVSAPASANPPVHRGFFSIIGGFFAHLFGF